ncbi:Spy/CpxP family protein refolding chaperone [Geminicoccus roseus]|uniref:Spy/CpxP family protein refolding chaperone n=1 Tax=Geminicoccus roseus TaxID=404900 RepID=UPI0003F8BC10|nr:Spy/CpxP family protein refolding chaperone [Geminicoccus roseus]
MRNWTAAGLGAIATVALIGGASVVAAPPDGNRGDRPMHEVRMKHGRGGMLGAFCGPAAGERLSERLTAFESFAKFEGEQQTSWVALRDTLTGAQPRVQAICAELRDLRSGNSVEKLTTVEEVLGEAAAIAADVRPAYATFYETLDEAQRDTLDKMFERPGRFMHRR